MYKGRLIRSKCLVIGIRLQVTPSTMLFELLHENANKLRQDEQTCKIHIVTIYTCLPIQAYGHFWHHTKL